MNDTQIDKVTSAGAHRGDDGQFVLSRGEKMALRMWRDEQPGDAKPSSTRAYEVVGFVVAGSAELVIDGATIALAAGDSWVVPAGMPHTYRIVEPFTAIEAISLS